jgi:hypothetical protein
LRGVTVITPRRAGEKSRFGDLGDLGTDSEFLGFRIRSLSSAIGERKIALNRAKYPPGKFAVPTGSTTNKVLLFLL